MLRIGPIARRLSICLVLWAAASRLWGQEIPEVSTEPGAVSLPKGVEINCEATLKQTENTYACTGPVAISWKQSRLQADSLTLRDGRYIEAAGNVLIVWGGNRLFGSRMTYDIETERGTIENAMGSVLNEWLIWAKTAEKIGEKKIRVKKAIVTTCSQPNPYWSFRVSRAIITIDNYARMSNVRVKTGKVPFFYLPYLVWPIKGERAAGLLFPEFKSNSQRGSAYSQELFIPLGRSADITLLGEYWGKSGFGGGGSVRFLPNRTGQGAFEGYFIDDQVWAANPARGNGDGRRYGYSYQQRQSFQNGFRMVADINAISDSSYYADFAEDLNLASSPDTLARLEFSRNGSFGSLNVRERRREQLSTGLVQQSLPEIEYRARNQKLGKTPLYLQFESSFASIQQRGSTITADYLRGDLFPTLSLPFSPTPWLDITPRFRYRWTYWTQRELLDFTDQTRKVFDEPLSRRLISYDVGLIGPKIFRIFETSRVRFKHSLEPQVRYGFTEPFDQEAEVIPYDEVDPSPRDRDRTVAYAIAQRLFASRPRARPPLPASGGESIVLPDGTTVEETPQSEETPTGPAEPLEIASLTISQSRSLDDDLSSGITDDTGKVETSPYGSVFLRGRYNPRPQTSVDLRATWNVIYDKFQDVTVSGGHRNRLTSVNLSIVHRLGLGFFSTNVGDQTVWVPREDDTQVRYSAAFNLMKDRKGVSKLQFSLAGSYVANPTGDISHFPQQTWRFRYATQCCTYILERLTRDIDDRRDWKFRVDLTGVGKILSHTF